MTRSSIATALFIMGIVFTSLFSEHNKIIVPIDYLTIQEALNKANEGDTVFVKNKIYKENIVMPDNIMLIGESVDKTIIRGDNKNAVVSGANYSTIMNFTIKRGGIGILSENTNMIIQNNVIMNNKKTGVQCLLSLPHIKNNIIIDNGWSGVFCELVAYGTRSAVEHNIIADNGYSGVNLSRKSGVLVQNNVFFRNGQFGIYVSKDSRKSRLIYNNFYKNRRSYNDDAVVDATNLSVDPDYPANAWECFSFYFGVVPGGLSDNKLEGYYTNPLLKMGKNGAPVGLVTKKGLRKLFKDSDEDGIADENDPCPGNAEDVDGFEDDDGCPDFDNDKDGIYDNKDGCPDAAEDFDGFEDMDGCPDDDNDKDGIMDTVDKCPGQKETVNGYKDEDGCPDQAPKKQ